MRSLFGMHAMATLAAVALILELTFDIACLLLWLEASEFYLVRGRSYSLPLLVGSTGLLAYQVV